VQAGNRITLDEGEIVRALMLIVCVLGVLICVTQMGPEPEITAAHYRAMLCEYSPGECKYVGVVER
jgi:nucleoside recognition membrane protein YjiH